MQHFVTVPDLHLVKIFETHEEVVDFAKSMSEHQVLYSCNPDAEAVYAKLVDGGWNAS